MCHEQSALQVVIKPKVFTFIFAVFLEYFILFLLVTPVQDSGFIQVRENWKRSGNLSGQGKSGKMQK